MVHAHKVGNASRPNLLQHANTHKVRQPTHNAHKLGMQRKRHLLLHLLHTTSSCNSSVWC
jgi:hypothetical protein